MRRLWWLPPVAAAALVGALDADAYPGDLPYFLKAAQTLLSADWAATFADAGLQVGPLFLAAIGAADASAGALGFPGSLTLAVATEAALAALVVLAARLVLRGRPRGRLLAAAAGCLAVAAGLPHLAYVGGHPAQVAVPALWLVAALQARSGRPVRAGVVLGAAAGLETWAVLGAPLLLLAGRPRAAAAGLVAHAMAAAALFAPFVVAGDFRMHEYEWEVAAGTLPGLFLPSGAAFPWELRLLQGAAALAVGSALALVLRRRPSAVWLVPAAAVAARLALDPVRYSWYWLALETVLIVGAADVISRPGELLLSRGQTPGRVPDGRVASPNPPAQAGPSRAPGTSRDGFVTPA